jgi:AAA family ATP:ADP antiporter
VDAETRYKTKNFIDTAVWRFGDVAVTGSLNLLRAAGAGVPGLALLAGVAAGCSGWVGWRAARSLDPAAAPPAQARV